MRGAALHDIRAELVARLRARCGDRRRDLQPRAQARRAGRRRRSRVPGRIARHRRRVGRLRPAQHRARRGLDGTDPRGRRGAGAPRRPATASAWTRCCAATRRATGCVGEFIMDEAGRLPNEALRQVLRTQGPHVDRLMASVAAEYMDELERCGARPPSASPNGCRRLLGADAPVDAAGSTTNSRPGTWAWSSPARGRRRRPHPGRRPRSPAARRRARRRQRLGLARAGAQRLAVIEVRALPGGRRARRRHARRRRAAPGARGLAPHPPRGEGRPAGDAAPAPAADPGQRRGPARRRAARRAAGQVAARDLPGPARRSRRLRARSCARRCAPTSTPGSTPRPRPPCSEVDRHTVQRRLRKVEEALGRLLHSCHAELEVALVLEELDREVERPRLGRPPAPETLVLSLNRALLSPMGHFGARGGGGAPYWCSGSPILFCTHVIVRRRGAPPPRRLAGPSIG